MSLRGGLFICKRGKIYLLLIRQSCIVRVEKENDQILQTLYKVLEAITGIIPVFC